MATLLDPVTNQYFTTPEAFARNYVDMLPENPYIASGVPDEVNPLKALENENLQKVVKSGSDFYFDPYRQRTFREATIPAVVNARANKANLAQNLSSAGLANSSYANAQKNILDLFGQMDLNRTTDQIQTQTEQARIAEETTRYLQELAQIQRILNLLPYQYNVPESISSTDTYQNQPLVLPKLF